MNITRATERSDGAGMLPNVPSIFDRHVVNSLLWRLSDRQFGMWDLIGKGDSKGDCGHVRLRGCLNTFEHGKDSGHIDNFSSGGGSQFSEGMVYVVVGHKHCFRPSCPVCYKAWVTRETERINHRFEHYHTRQKPIHYIASVPKSEWFESKDKLQKKCNKLALKTHFQGGCSIFHPYREACIICGTPKEPHLTECLNCGSHEFNWHFSPHFHMIGFGWIKETAGVYKETQWVFVNEGIRDSVKATAWYQLSHCGVYYGKNRKHSVTWFGSMTYRHLHVSLMERKKEVCKYCGQELVPLDYNGVDDIPDKEGGYLLRFEGWVQRLHYWDSG